MDHMNHKHRATLLQIFTHPVSANIDPRDVKHVLEALGADISHGGHGHLMVKLNGHSHGFHDAHHSMPKEEVTALRKFLEDAGVDPALDHVT
jgi:hypothetical protein